VRGLPAAGVVVRFRGQLRRTSTTGVARFDITLPLAGRFLARASRADLRPATVAVRGVVRVPASCARTFC
jgi:hypothetical protein